MKPTPPQTPQQQQECHLDELGYIFVKKCIETIEARGLDDQGLYRIGGVNSRVARLLQLCLDRKNYNQLTGQVTMPDFSDPVEWETKTITSALKNYLRNLSEPLMTYNLHPSIIEAAKIENGETRSSRIKSLIQQLPIGNFTLLKILVEHLKNVASHSQKNLMTVSNLGICFAPTLMRGPDESALSIMEIKYSNVVANTLIEEYDSIFNDIKMTRSQMIKQQNQQIQELHQEQIHQEQLQLQQQQLIHHHQHQHHHQQQQQQQQQPQLQQPSQQRQQSYQNNHILGQQIRFAQPAIQVNNNHYQDDRFALELRELQYHPKNIYTNNNQPQPFKSPTNSLPMHSIQYYPLNINNLPYRSTRAITLYACVADMESELSFGPNEIIKDVRHSAEVGWLVGTLERNGQRGLLPENYVKFI